MILIDYELISLPVVPRKFILLPFLLVPGLMEFPPSKRLSRPIYEFPKRKLREEGDKVGKIKYVENVTHAETSQAVFFSCLALPATGLFLEAGGGLT